jgi:hypothetical protein
MEIHSGAAGYGQPRGEVDIVLKEYARSDERVRKAGDVTGTVRVPLGSSSSYPRVPSVRAAQRNLPEQQFMTVPFNHLPKLMLMLL